MYERQLAEALTLLAREINASAALRKRELDWLKSTVGLATKKDLKELGEKIMATQAELAASLRTVVTQLQKTSSEIKGVQVAVTDLKAKIEELQAIIDAGGTITQELTDAVEAVKLQAQVVDDEIPDLPPPPPVTV